MNQGCPQLPPACATAGAIASPPHVHVYVCTALHCNAARRWPLLFLEVTLPSCVPKLGALASCCAYPPTRVGTNTCGHGHASLLALCATQLTSPASLAPPGPCRCRRSASPLAPWACRPPGVRLLVPLNNQQHRETEYSVQRLARLGRVDSRVSVAATAAAHFIAPPAGHCHGRSRQCRRLLVVRAPAVSSSTYK